MKIVKSFLLFIITIVFIGIAWKNNSDAQLSLWPFSASIYTVPVFVIILFSIIGGILLTLALVSVVLIRNNVSIKKLEEKNAKLNEELTILKIKDSNL